MTRLSGLLLAAAGLVSVIALETGSMPRDETVPSRMPAAVAVAPAPSPAADHMSEWVTTVLARPLFSPDRRPAAVAGTVAANLPGLPRLAGILVGPFGRSAIFAVNGAKPIVVHEGERVAAYTVKSIEASQVRLLGPNGAQVLNPSFEPAATPARRPGQTATAR
jgi:hypothetical protein